MCNEFESWDIEKLFQEFEGAFRKFDETKRDIYLEFAAALDTEIRRRLDQ